jgi:DNA-3-methyladenine glycosylase
VHDERSGIIVETEAYLGPEDRASHARFGMTERNRSMFGPGGVSYVYLCYGVHEMFNIVSGPDGDAGAVLIRALAMDTARGLDRDPSVARGPGKLTRAMGITRAQNGLDLTQTPSLYVTRGIRVSSTEVATGPRIGVDYAGSWALEPLRFYVCGHPAVSLGRVSVKTHP